MVGIVKLWWDTFFLLENSSEICSKIKENVIVHLWACPHFLPPSTHTNKKMFQYPQEFYKRWWSRFNQQVHSKGPHSSLRKPSSASHLLEKKYIHSHCLLPDLFLFAWVQRGHFSTLVFRTVIRKVRQCVTSVCSPTNV